MTWRMSKALKVLLAEINAISPNRDKSSDGGIGDPSHSARTSDHNPDDDGVVKARDFTNDPAHGIVSEEIAEALRALRNPNIKYIISNKKIAASYQVGNSKPWEWRPYGGANPHNHHVHVSVLADKAHFDDETPWQLAKWLGKPISNVIPMAPVKPIRPTLRKGDKGADVIQLQSLLNKHGLSLKEDGDFGNATRAAVFIFQEKVGLVADGVVGKYSWESLEK